MNQNSCNPVASWHILRFTIVNNNAYLRLWGTWSLDKTLLIGILGYSHHSIKSWLLIGMFLWSANEQRWLMHTNPRSCSSISFWLWWWKSLLTKSTVIGTSMEASRLPRNLPPNWRLIVGLIVRLPLFAKHLMFFSVLRLKDVYNYTCKRIGRQLQRGAYFKMHVLKVKNSNCLIF